MRLNPYTDEELAKMHAIVTAKRNAAHKKYYGVIVVNADKLAIQTRKRLSGLIRFYDGTAAQIEHKLGRERLGECRLTQRMRDKHLKPEWWQEKFESLVDKQSGLPQHLIGNATIRELPLDQLYNYRSHNRLIVFIRKGLCCSRPTCTRVASRLIETMDAHGTMHLDLFTADLQHMNVDHILAKSNGGNNKLKNKQPMCAYHNSKKGNKLVEY